MKKENPHLIYKIKWGQITKLPFYCCVCYSSVQILIKKLQADYGIVLISEAERIHGKSLGPIYAITKLPWISESLPTFQYKSQEVSVDFAEAKMDYFEKSKLCKEIDDLYGSCKDVESEKSRVEDEFYSDFHIKPYYHH